MAKKEPRRKRMVFPLKSFVEEAEGLIESKEAFHKWIVDLARDDLPRLSTIDLEVKSGIAKACCSSLWKKDTSVPRDVVVFLCEYLREKTGKQYSPDEVSLPDDITEKRRMGFWTALWVKMYESQLRKKIRDESNIEVCNTTHDFDEAMQMILYSTARNTCVQHMKVDGNDVDAHYVESLPDSEVFAFAENKLGFSFDQVLGRYKVIWDTQRDAFRFVVKQVNGQTIRIGATVVVPTTEDFYKRTIRSEVGYGDFRPEDIKAPSNHIYLMACSEAKRTDIPEFDDFTHNQFHAGMKSIAIFAKNFHTNILNLRVYMHGVMKMNIDRAVNFGYERVGVGLNKPLFFPVYELSFGRSWLGVVRNTLHPIITVRRYIMKSLLEAYQDANYMECYDFDEGFYQSRLADSKQNPVV